MYNEDLVSVKHMINEIKSTKLLQDLNTESHKPQTIIYTKNPTANLATLKEATGVDVVERLENVGREGGTYLKHIVNKWDSLA